jgi:hypothetical protein
MNIAGTLYQPVMVADITGTSSNAKNDRVNNRTCIISAAGEIHDISQIREK